ncbi:uncharacterized protein LOC106062236 [Biomphalaria glabrata]|uniref:Uncharacterized protein LOC106062236 n=1 Tax=Biomphalaria glabrata TaxID=6526 RepID=A0A9W2Z618_BIOGL|nr:uncharacterized protein LOC106062236 [Biomphalaria glabrata]XP_055870440.1 uncharacterized protein LOC106062236 [Biomphalaria glabrata]XP_055870441.1 uncharacterized protein LOC106062236 [Biomphalaria glabrata]XP_055870442.1 uncharacterized protein LOC106062236 [Biomphalaria glabrata]
MRVPCKTMSRGNLKPEHKKCIQTLYKYLKDNIDASLIVDFLYQEKIIGLEEKETILLEKRKSDKNELLLKYILNSRALNSFDIFHQSLKSRHKNVYETIENELKRITQTLCGARLEDVEKREKGEVYLCGLTVLLFSVNKTDSQVVSKTLMNGKPLKKTLGIKMGTTCHSERKLNFVKSPQIEKCMKDYVNIIEKLIILFTIKSKGYHAFLIAIRYAGKMANTDLQVIETLKILFGPNILKKYVVLLLIYEDEIKKQKICIKNWLSRQDKHVKKMFKECGERAVIFNTKTGNLKYLDQIETIVKVVDNLQFNGRRYTLDTFKEAEKGRTKLLEEENEHKTSSALTKCRELLESCNVIIANDNKENINKMVLLIEEAQSLKKHIIEEDACTNVLFETISAVESVINSLESHYKKLVEIEQSSNDIGRKLHETERYQNLEQISRIESEIRSLEEELSIKDNEKRILKEKLQKTNESNLKIEKEIEKNNEEQKFGDEKMNELKLMNMSLRKKGKTKRKTYFITYFCFICLIIALIASYFRCYGQNEHKQKSTLSSGLLIRVDNYSCTKFNSNLYFGYIKYKLIRQIARECQALGNNMSQILQNVKAKQRKIKLIGKEREKREIENQNILYKLIDFQLDCKPEHANMTQFLQRLKRSTLKKATKLKKIKRLSKKRRIIFNQNVQELILDFENTKLYCYENTHTLSKKLKFFENKNEVLAHNLTTIQKINQETKDKIEKVKHVYHKALVNCKLAMSHCTE